MVKDLTMKIWTNVPSTQSFSGLILPRASLTFPAQPASLLSGATPQKNLYSTKVKPAGSPRHTVQEMAHQDMLQTHCNYSQIHRSSAAKKMTAGSRNWQKHKIPCLCLERTGNKEFGLWKCVCQVLRVLYSRQAVHTAVSEYIHLCYDLNRAFLSLPLSYAVMLVPV